MSGSQQTITIDGRDIPASKEFIEKAMDRCRKLIDKGFQVEHYTEMLHSYRDALRVVKRRRASNGERRKRRDALSEKVRARREHYSRWPARLGLDESNDVPHDDEYYIKAQTERPRTRADCLMGARPCPFVGCKYNLWMDVRVQSKRKGYTPSIKPNRPDKTPWDMPPGQSCVLDIAEADGMTLEEVGEMLCLTRERVRQLQELALARLAKRIDPALREDVLSLDNDTTWGIMQDERH